MSRAELASAVAGIARVMAADHKVHAELAPAFLLLTESLAEIVHEPESKKEARIRRLVEIEHTLPRMPAKRRAGIVADAMGIHRSSYYDARATAIERGLLEQPSPKIPNN